MTQERWNNLIRLLMIGLAVAGLCLSSGNRNGLSFFDWDQLSAIIEALNTHEGWVKLAFTYGPLVWVLARMFTGSNWSLLYDILGLGHSILLWGTVSPSSATPLPWTQNGAIALIAAFGIALLGDLIKAAVFSNSAIQF